MRQVKMDHLPDMSIDGSLIIEGDSLSTMRQLPSEIVRCVVTSPPYWGLRDYNPFSCRAKANLQGMPIKSFGFKPFGVSGRTDIALAGFFLSVALYPRFPLV